MARFLQRLLVCFAFAAALCAPAMARAALVPDCDARDQLTRMPVEWVAPTPPPSSADACDAGHDGGDTQTPGAAATLAPAPAPDEVGDSRVPAMCDERGACVIAPPRIHPVADDRIEAPAGCAWDDGGGPMCGPGHHHAPEASHAPALAEHAVLDGAALVPPATSEPAPPFPPVQGGVRVGFERGIDRPPR